MDTILLILGGVALVEGAMLAFVPHRFRDALEWIASQDEGTIRTLGLGCVTVGLFLLWIARYLV